MSLLIAVIWALVYVVCFAIAIYLIIWVFEIVTDKQLPPKVVQLLWVLLALVAVALIITALAGHLPTFRLGAPGLGGGAFAALPSAPA
jgi:ABC-type bacteriocin/lantibiotic exporter with double-glycine peptidase domain